MAIPLPVTRRGDPDMLHCTQGIRSTASNKVFVNGRGVVRTGDFGSMHYGHTRNGVGNHRFVGSGGEAPFQSNDFPTPTHPICWPHKSCALRIGMVLVEGKSLVRVGDPLFPNCTFVAGGSPNVLAT